MDLIGIVAAAAAARAVPYMTRARWRAGPLGTRIPTAPRRLPDTNPVVNAYGSRAERRMARAARIASRR